MDFNEYQAAARETAIYPSIGNNYIYPLLGLADETGEVFGKFKKLMRDKDGIITEEFIEEIKKEIGDICWYISTLCSELSLSLDDVAVSNIEKLRSRKERGVLKGSGDNR